MNETKRVVFISWSGTASKTVASALRDWLPQVLQNLVPFMSEHDIAKGSRGQDEIASKLRDAALGIICLTPDNLKAPWVLFEAGALSNSLTDRELVCPYLIGLKKKDVPPPLSLFQLANSSKEDTLRLVADMNMGFDTSVRLPERNLERQFAKWWPELEGKIQEAAETVQEDGNEPTRGPDEILGEVLEAVRRLERELDRDRFPLRQEESPLAGSEFVAPRFVPGERVVHPQFGYGVIAEISGAGRGEPACSCRRPGQVSFIGPG